MTGRVKLAIWTSTVGLCVFVLRRALARRRATIDVGSVSGDWIAERRATGDDFAP